MLFIMIRVTWLWIIQDVFILKDPYAAHVWLFIPVDPLNQASPQTYIIFVVVALDLLLRIFELSSNPKSEAKTLLVSSLRE